MPIHLRDARQHNIKDISITFQEDLTGVSGSSKTSLVFDTLYYEARRRFLDVYLYGRGGQRLSPARVESITGLHPFFRLLYTNYGERHCLACGHYFPEYESTIQKML